MAKSKAWYRDKIDQLKNEESRLRWIFTILITLFLGALSLLITSIYKSNFVKEKVLLIGIEAFIAGLFLVFVFVTRNRIRKNTRELNYNYSKLLEG